MTTRRHFLRLAALLSAGGAPWPRGLAQEKKPKPEPGTILVNDVHAQLNSARVWRIATPQTLDEVRSQLRAARKEERNVCISGSRHAMGGQQFCADAVMLDIRKLNRVLAFDRERGLLEVEAGVQWPQILEYLHESQRGEARAWAFAQKQTGADRFTIGGCLSANIHGRGLTMAPFIQDVESFKLIDAKGGLRNCSRAENPELFSLAIGGYGLFGFIYSATLRLVPRRKLERVVELRAVDSLMEAFAGRIRDGYLYGDYHYALDESSKDFLREGVFTCYRPVPDDTPMLGIQRQLTSRDWIDLLHLAHTKKPEAFRRYASHYLATGGQLYWSDEHQMSVYPDDYHRVLERRMKAENRAAFIPFIMAGDPDGASSLDLLKKLPAAGADLIETVATPERAGDGRAGGGCVPWLVRPSASSTMSRTRRLDDLDHMSTVTDSRVGIHRRGRTSQRGNGAVAHGESGSARNDSSSIPRLLSSRRLGAERTR